jgi:hypothetical protein
VVVGVTGGVVGVGVVRGVVVVVVGRVVRVVFGDVGVLGVVMWVGVVVGVVVWWWRWRCRRGCSGRLRLGDDNLQRRGGPTSTLPLLTLI